LRLALLASAGEMPLVTYAPEAAQLPVTITVPSAEAAGSLAIAIAV
jgi:hypothetical protein